MKYFWQLSNSIAALYGALVVILAAVLMHVWNTSLTPEYTARVVSAVAILAFHTLSLMAIGQHFSPAKLTKLAALLWHIGLWCFVWTILAGVFALPFHYAQLAPIGGHLLIVAWLLLTVSAWRRR